MCQLDPVLVAVLWQDIVFQPLLLGQLSIIRHLLVLKEITCVLDLAQKDESRENGGRENAESYGVAKPLRVVVTQSSLCVLQRVRFNSIKTRQKEKKEHSRKQSGFGRDCRDVVMSELAIHLLVI
jgi:hypothetical protein